MYPPLAGPSWERRDENVQYLWMSFRQGNQSKTKKERKENRQKEMIKDYG
jgi:hypothetical protein